MRRVRCEERLKAALRAGEQSQAYPAAEPKGAPWKVAGAAWMKQIIEASNGWLAERLAMLSSSRVSRVTTVFRFGRVNVGQLACERGLARASGLTYGKGG